MLLPMLSCILYETRPVCWVMIPGLYREQETVIFLQYQQHFQDKTFLILYDDCVSYFDYSTEQQLYCLLLEKLNPGEILTVIQTTILLKINYC